MSKRAYFLAAFLLVVLIIGFAVVYLVGSATALSFDPAHWSPFMRFLCSACAAAWLSMVAREAVELTD